MIGWWMLRESLTKERDPDFRDVRKVISVSGLWKGIEVGI